METIRVILCQKVFAFAICWSLTEPYFKVCVLRGFSLHVDIYRNQRPCNFYILCRVFFSHFGSVLATVDLNVVIGVTK